MKPYFCLHLQMKKQRHHFGPEKAYVNRFLNDCTMILLLLHKIRISTNKQQKVINNRKEVDSMNTLPSSGFHDASNVSVEAATLSLDHHTRLQFLMKRVRNFMLALRCSEQPLGTPGPAVMWKHSY